MENIKLCINCEHCFKKDYSQVYWCRKTEKINLVDGSKVYLTCEDYRQPFTQGEYCGLEGKYYYDKPF